MDVSVLVQHWTAEFSLAEYVSRCLELAHGDDSSI